MYDAAGFHKKMTMSDVDRIAVIVLRPGVPEGLRRTSVLLRTFVRSVWAHDVIDLNRAELDAEDIDGFLFGTDRTALRALVDPLRDLQSGRCFYCDGRLQSDVHIDHVVPWSMIPIDGVANLVATDARCNLDKSASIPVQDHVTRAWNDNPCPRFPALPASRSCTSGRRRLLTACMRPCLPARCCGDRPGRTNRTRLNDPRPLSPI